MTQADIFVAIIDERNRQDRKHGEGSMRRCADNIRLAILTEEVGEVARAIIEGDAENLREELVQVAACAVAWIEAIDSERERP